MAIRSKERSRKVRKLRCLQGGLPRRTPNGLRTAPPAAICSSGRRILCIRCKLCKERKNFMIISKSIRKRGLALFLAFMMCLSTLPAAALAANTAETCGCGSPVMYEAYSDCHYAFAQPPNVLTRSSPATATQTAPASAEQLLPAVRQTPVIPPSPASTNTKAAYAAGAANRTPMHLPCMYVRSLTRATTVRNAVRSTPSISMSGITTSASAASSTNTSGNIRRTADTPTDSGIPNTAPAA